MNSVFSWQTLLAYALLHFVLQDQTFLLVLVSPFYFCIPVPYDEKGLFGVLVLEGLVGPHRTIQFQAIQHYWLGHRFELL